MNEKSINHRNLFCCCSNSVIAFLAFLFAFTLGLIFGAVFGAVFLTALPTLIASAVILAIMIITILIFRRCYSCRNNLCSE